DIISDQFLGRVLKKKKVDGKDGRDHVLEIMQHFRDLGLKVMFQNGLELSKLTVGRSLQGGDLTPDTELIEALLGDGLCASFFIGGERPVDGPSTDGGYPKLLDPEAHFEMMQTIVATGVPDITYVNMVGDPSDTHHKLEHLERYLHRLRDSLYGINPKLKISINPNAFIPLPGVPMTKELKSSGLLGEIPHPALVSNWTPHHRSHYLSTEEIVAWQARLFEEFVIDGRRGVTVHRGYDATA
ncbi:MAG: hypothetical protein AAFO91_15310, partial [Bacteroidota bacterium]